MADETSGEIRIMTIVAKLAKDVEDVRTIVTAKRCDDCELLESHDTDIQSLKNAVNGHEKELLDLHNQMARVIRELTVGNITAERNEKKLDRILSLLEKK